MLIAPKRLKIRTSNLAGVFAGIVPTWLWHNYYVSEKWAWSGSRDPIHFWTLNANNSSKFGKRTWQIVSGHVPRQQYRAYCSNGTDTAFHRTYSCCLYFWFLLFLIFAYTTLNKLFAVFVISYSAHRSDNFVIGLTNVSAQDQAPVLYKYTMCGQYPGTVPPSATVSLRCNDTDLPPARFVVVQFPTTDYMNLCELNVCAKGTTDLALCSFTWRCIVITSFYKLWSLFNIIFCCFMVDFRLKFIIKRPSEIIVVQKFDCRVNKQIRVTEFRFWYSMTVTHDTCWYRPTGWAKK